jgi:hypothetical protein
MMSEANTVSATPHSASVKNSARGLETDRTSKEKGEALNQNVEKDEAEVDGEQKTNNSFKLLAEYLQREI